MGAKRVTARATEDGGYELLLDDAVIQTFTPEEARANTKLDATIKRNKWEPLNAS